jgi:hypothetical protein
MPSPRLLVTATITADHVGRLVEVDADTGTCEVVLPYRCGGIWSSPDEVYLAHIDPHKNYTRLEVFDRGGLAWARRIPDCIDTHCVAVTDDEIVLTSTGTNQVIFLDRHGHERSRWSPDPGAEPDASHLNHIVHHEGRWLLSCFGAFPRFRDWNVKDDPGFGLLLEVPSGRVVARGFIKPHDPLPVEGGLLVCNSRLGQLLFVPEDGGPRRLVGEWPGLFTRGLLHWQDRLYLGLSANRVMQRVCPGVAASRHAQVVVLTWPQGRVEKIITIPFREIGQIVPSPSDDVMAALRKSAVDLPVASDERYDAAARAGSLRVLESEPLNTAEVCQVRIQLTNRSHTLWTSDNHPPLQVGYQLVDDAGVTIRAGLLRRQLPLAIAPGRTLTFSMPIDVSVESWHPAAGGLRITLVQGADDWWQPSEHWSPAVVPLSSQAPPTSEQRLRILTQTRESEQTRQALVAAQARLAEVGDLGPAAMRVARLVSRTARNCRSLLRRLKLTKPPPAQPPQRRDVA